MNAINIYKLARWCYLHKIPLIPQLLKGFIFVLYNSFIPYTAKIGKGSRFAYGAMGIVVHKDAVIVYCDSQNRRDYD